MKPQTAKPEILIQTVERDDPEVMALYEPFILEADGPLAHEIDVGAEAGEGPPADLVPPAGAMLLARVDGEPAAIGGVRHLDTEVAEVKSMYVSPAHRGLGLGRRILDELHRIAAESSCRAIRLDTSDYLTAAIGLYRAAGYREVGDYNRNPKASLWFERLL
jgi:ribosomal protein S18 acetylase RimI-like enzyme